MVGRHQAGDSGALYAHLGVPDLRAWDGRRWGFMPEWAHWFLAAGYCLAQAREGLVQWVVVTVPDRAFAAVLAAAGAVARGFREQNGSSPEELHQLQPGQAITWLDAHGNLAAGRHVGWDSGRVQYEKRRRNGTWERRLRAPEAFASCRPMLSGEEPFAGSRPLLSNADFVRAALAGVGDECFATPAVDARVCGTQTELVAELSASEWSAGGRRGRLLDLVRPYGRVELGERPRCVLLSSRSYLEEVSVPAAPFTVFDGVPAYRRWRDALASPSNLVVVDRWSTQAADLAPLARAEQMQRWVEEPILGLPDLPPVLEAFAWVEES